MQFKLALLPNLFDNVIQLFFFFLFGLRLRLLVWSFARHYDVSELKAFNCAYLHAIDAVKNKQLSMPQRVKNLIKRDFPQSFKSFDCISMREYILKHKESFANQLIDVLYSFFPCFLLSFSSLFETLLRLRLRFLIFSASFDCGFF